MKIFAFVLVSSLVGFSAHSLEFALNCRPAMKGVPTNIIYQAVKVPVNKNGKWISTFFVRAMGPAFPGGPATLPLKPAGSGDENYSEYNIVDPQHISGLQGAYIEDHFQWVTLIDVKGYGAYDCRAQNK